MDPTPEIIAEMASLPDICQRAGVDDDLFARMSFSMGGTPTHARNVALIPGQAWDLALLNLPNTATAGANVTPAGGPKPLEWGCLPALRRVTHLVCGLDPNEPQTDGSFILTNSGPESPTAQQQGIPPLPQPTMRTSSSPTLWSLPSASSSYLSQMQKSKTCGSATNTFSVWNHPKKLNLQITNYRQSAKCTNTAGYPASTSLYSSHTNVGHSSV